MSQYKDYISKDVVERAKETWDQFQEGLKYMYAINLQKRISDSWEFYKGNQWAPTTENTKFLPRPVTNIVRRFVDLKCAAMNNKPVKIEYEADIPAQSTQGFNRFSDFMWKQLQMELLNEKAVRSGAIKGTYIYHHFWDAQSKGTKGKVAGSLDCEVLDPRDVVFANPRQKDEQKQKYIIIRSIEEVEAIKENLPKGIDEKLIVEDDRDEKSNKDTAKKQDTPTCTVLTKYFRIDGEVYCEKSVRGTVIREAFPLRPDYEETEKEMFEKADEANADSPDDKEDTKRETRKEKSSKYGDYKATLYPIAVGQYIEDDNSIYGISEAEGLIPNQKLINLCDAMNMLQLQEESWSKWIVKKDALRGQVITNQPGQTIVDFSAGGDGVKRVQGAPITASSVGFTESFIQRMRAAVGSTEVMSGEVVSANMSGAAIAQLQSQAQQPIEELRKAFWRVQEKNGRILEMFYRAYFHNGYDYKYKNINEETGDPEIISAKFSASDYKDIEFTVVAKATLGTTSSPAGDIAVLDILRSEGAITILQYLESYPEQALSDKNHLVDMAKQAEKNKLMQAEAQIAELQQQLVQALESIQKMEKALNAVQQTNKENESLREDLAQAYNKLREILNKSQAVVNENATLQMKNNNLSSFAQQIAGGLNDFDTDEI